MFNKVTIYEVKVDRQEEFENLFQEINKFYRSMDGVIDLKFFKRNYRQADFSELKKGALPIRLKRLVIKVTYVFCLSVENEYLYANISKKALELYYKRIHNCLTTLPKVILGENLE